uniref:Uncharacterized protein n=1 Tax=Solanum tuberosum TaxID=4113 RepID=M1BKM1_SOLTU
MSEVFAGSVWQWAMVTVSGEVLAGKEDEVGFWMAVVRPWRLKKGKIHPYSF